MAKLSGSAKRAFLAKMAKGRAAAARRRKKRGPVRKALAKRKVRRRKNAQLLTITNPSKIPAALLRRYRAFHGVNPKRALVSGRGKVKGLIALGDVVEIVYEPKRGERKRIHWFHKFKRKAILATDVTGKELYIVDPKGRVMVDFQRGIVA